MECNSLNKKCSLFQLQHFLWRNRMLTLNSKEWDHSIEFRDRIQASLMDRIHLSKHLIISNMRHQTELENLHSKD
jgi:hypothetical protein